MATSAIIEESAAELMARSTAYGLIAHCFRYPNADWTETMTDSSRWADWPELLISTDESLRESLCTLREAVESFDGDAVHARFAWLFGHTVRGSCPPYELEYGAEEILQRASELADIAGFYSAFGLELLPDAQERPDHLSVECEFMAALQSKEATSHESGATENEAICRGASRKFLAAHLGRWFPAFTRRVTKAECDGFYGRAAAFADCFIVSECFRLGVPVGSPYLEVRNPDPEQETEQSCGVPSLCGPALPQPLVQLNTPSTRGSS